MEYVLGFILGTILSWIGLLIVIPIAQKLADFSMPPWPEALWKLAVVAGAGNAVAVALGPINAWLSLIVGAVLFFVLMFKWFDIDFFGACVIVVATWVLRSVLMALLLGLFAAATAGAG